MRTLSVSAALSLVVLSLACGRGNEFREAIPGQDAVRLAVPETAGQALSVGEQSELYRSTRDIARGVNGGVLWSLAVIDFIVGLPPTEVSDDTAVWGPSEPEGLENISWRLTVTRLEEGVYEYALDGREKSNTDEADFRTVISGVSQPGEGDTGHGTLTLDWDAARALDDSACLVGTADVTYGVDEVGRAVDVIFHDAANACEGEEPKPATYHYFENPDRSGDFSFSVSADIHDEEEQKPLIETLTIKSRWLATGTGRSDVIISGGEVPEDLATYLPDSGLSDVRATECWDDGFALTFADTSPDELESVIKENVGDADACPFAEADYADPAAL